MANSTFATKIESINADVKEVREDIINMIKFGQITDEDTKKSVINILMKIDYKILINIENVLTKSTTSSTTGTTNSTNSTNPTTGSTTGSTPNSTSGRTMSWAEEVDEEETRGNYRDVAIANIGNVANIVASDNEQPFIAASIMRQEIRPYEDNEFNGNSPAIVLNTNNARKRFEITLTKLGLELPSGYYSYENDQWSARAKFNPPKDVPYYQICLDGIIYGGNIGKVVEALNERLYKSPIGQENKRGIYYHIPNHLNERGTVVKKAKNNYKFPILCVWAKSEIMTDIREIVDEYLQSL